MILKIIYRLLFISLLFITFSCRNSDRQYSNIINHAEKIIEEHPDSTFYILNGLDSVKNKFSVSMKMKYEMLLASAKNKSNMSFTTDSIAKIFTKYYDKNGTHNQQMTAHYLLGCTYRDMGDAPMTLKCYNDAIEKADTTSDDCDFNQLSRVYGQLGVLFIDQKMPLNAMCAFNHAEKYAWISKDTIMTIMSIGYKAHVYEIQNNNYKIIQVIEKTYKLFKKYGYNSEAAGYLGAAIQSLVLTKQYRKAKQYIDIYESESGLFKNGNVEKGKEIYYYIKGLYYLGINSDSASIMFNKEMKYTSDIYNKMNAAYGLFSFYKKKNITDSLSKYAEVSFIYNDSVLNTKSTETLQKMSSQYNYNRAQIIAEKKSAETQKTLFILYISIAIFFILISISMAFILYMRMKAMKNRKDEETKILILKQKYNDMQNQLEKEEHDLILLKRDKQITNNIIYDKEKSIEILNNTISELKKGLSFNDCKFRKDIDKVLLCENISIKFKNLSKIGKIPSNADWNLMKDTFDELFPQFKLLLSHDYPLKEDEYRLCILIRLGFSPKAIQFFLNISASYVSNMRRRLSLKLFYIEESPKEFDKKIRKIF